MKTLTVRRGEKEKRTFLRSGGSEECPACGEGRHHPSSHALELAPLLHPLPSLYPLSSPHSSRGFSEPRTLAELTKPVLQCLRPAFLCMLQELTSLFEITSSSHSLFSIKTPRSPWCLNYLLGNQGSPDFSLGQLGDDVITNSGPTGGGTGVSVGRECFRHLIHKASRTST